MSASPELQRIAALIDAEAGELRAFVSLLEREEALLVAGDADPLVALAREKTERCHRLQRLHDERTQLLARLRRPHTDAAIRELVAALPNVLERWNEVGDLARNAEARNALNGKLIAERMQHNQAALSVLMNAAEQPALYDAAGMARPVGGGRHLGSA